MYYTGNTSISHTVFTYYDGPNNVNISSSLHNVTVFHDRETNGGSAYSIMSRSDHSSGLTSPHGSHQQISANYRSSVHHRLGNPVMTTNSEGNLLSMNSYSTIPQKHKIASKSDRVLSTRNNLSNSASSSSDSISSVTDGTVNHNSDNLYTYSPEKSKRVNPMHYAAGYRSHQGNVRVRTLYACLGENDGELSFEPNQIITNVRASQEPGWLEGTLNGKTGLVPENYVEILP
ncbi:GTPase regulator associated with FAK [Carabus blaptoides fortunei]